MYYMKLKEILNNIEFELIQGSLDIQIEDISYDSRNIDKSKAFVALNGIDVNGHNYVKNAYLKGSMCAIICEDIDISDLKDMTIVKIEDTRKQLSYLSANLFGHPADKLIKIGITGTKGKTTTSYMIKSILEKANEKVGIIGTIGTIIDGTLYEHKNTTPESYLIQKYMRKMVDTNTKYLIMEVSSQALKVGRVNNICYDYAIFTNLSIDHIGDREHPTFEDYVYSKSLLFKQSKVAILNKDDEHYERMLNNDIKNYTYGSNDCDLILEKFNCINKNNDFGIEITTKNYINDTFIVNSPGEFSAFNALSVIMLCSLLNIDINCIKNGLKNFKVPGRFEIYNLKNNAKAFIDYAHNKISFEKIIKTLREYNPNKITVVFGCGGGRSYDRRYELGETAGLFSDFSIITTDNPRNDNIDDINKDIEEGLINVNGKYIIIKDREEAIRYAIDNSSENDFILLLGKGHEKFQEIGNEIFDFSEEDILKDYIK